MLLLERTNFSGGFSILLRISPYFLRMRLFEPRSSVNRFRKLERHSRRVRFGNAFGIFDHGPSNVKASRIREALIVLDFSSRGLFLVRGSVRKYLERVRHAKFDRFGQELVGTAVVAHSLEHGGYAMDGFSGAVRNRVETASIFDGFLSAASVLVQRDYFVGHDDPLLFRKARTELPGRMRYIRFQIFGKFSSYSASGSASRTVALASAESRTPQPRFSKCFCKRSSTRKNLVAGSF